jgi:DNA-directed RNA polymerase subunit RPC12/RpoP
MLAGEIFHQEEIETKTSEKKKVEALWGCHTCGKGVLRLVIIGRAGQDYYMRKCDYCDHKTRMQKHTPDITGA